MCECLLAQAQLSFLSGGSEISDLVIKHLWWTNWVAVIFKAQLGQENDEMKRSVLDVDGSVNKARGGSLYLSGWWLLSDDLYSSGKSYSFGICDSDVHDENDSSCAFCGETWDHCEPIICGETRMRAILDRIFMTAENHISNDYFLRKMFRHVNRYIFNISPYTNDEVLL